MRAMTVLVVVTVLTAAGLAEELPPKLAAKIQQAEQLGGYTEVVDGEPVGMSFIAIEKLVFDAPNEVILPTVTDESLAIIKAFPRLKRLSLSDANISDAGMVHVGALAELEVLSLRRTKVTQAGLKHLEHCKRLRSLDLMGMDLSADGLKALTVNMQLARTLRELHVSSATIDDQAAAVLPSFPSLRVLRLSGTQVSDSAVVHLSKLKKLEALYVNSTRITAKGNAALRKALPDTTIVTDDPPP